MKLGVQTTRSTRPPPLPYPVCLKQTEIYGTVASSPRAATDRLLGCVGMVRVDTNY